MTDPHLWLGWAQRIQSIAQAGLTYSKDPYDLERFTQLRELAAEIMAQHTTVPHELLRTALSLEEGYLTPKVDVRAVVFDAEGRLLLVRERAKGEWSLPGGWADVGDSPGEVAARETAEESGYIVKPMKMLAVYDRAKHDHPPLIWYTYKLFIRCTLLSGSPRESLETSGAAFFARDGLPALSRGRVTAAQIRRMFEHYDDPTLPTDFD
ncbi:MAG TPA: NUDIX hydrolase [Symbiobacteriaceae bacterium]|nr:NUDIX hydrolase [Symbiobacteriaceae bacterium]